MTKQLEQNMDVAYIVDKILENAKEFPAFNPEIRNWDRREPTRQGDIYFVPVERKAANLKPLKDHKVFPEAQTKEGQGIRLVPTAPGETKGSNHILILNKNIKIYYPTDKVINLMGPIFSLAEGGEALVVHPEHAGIRFQGAACGEWSVGYQEDVIRQQRTQD